MSGEDPSYQAATDKNLVSENGGWGQGEEPVDADLDGMGDFVKNMETLKDNLGTHSWYFTEVAELPNQGLGVTGYDDGVTTMRVLAANAAEFQGFYQMLKQGYMNIAMGGQDCIDAMGGKDNLNGISLNAVKFALDLPGADRPAGLPKQIGKTWSDAFMEQQEEQGSTDPASQGGETSHWTPGGAGPPPTPGMDTKTYTDQYGNTRTVMTSTDGNTRIITQTSADGKSVVTTKTVDSGGSTTTTTTRQENLFTPKEKTTKTTSTSTTEHTDHSTNTTDTDNDGDPTSRRTVTESRDGTTTTTDTNYDGKGKPSDSPSVSVGDERPDPEMPESPVPGAMESIR